MVARAPTAPDPRGLAQWYSQQELADMWRVHYGTVRNWLVILRREDLGPRPGQSRVLKINRARRFVLLRADYARFMQQRFVERMK